jgi:hypothetical protein
LTRLFLYDAEADMMCEVIEEVVIEEGLHGIMDVCASLNHTSMAVLFVNTF